MDLSNKQIMVTGASSGIGRATSILISELGGKVFLVGRNMERLEETRNQMTGEGHVTIPFDLSNFNATEEWFQAITSSHGPFDGLVHSAGIRSTLPLRTIREADYSHIMDINVKAAVALAKSFCKKGSYREGSSIVMLSSIMGIVGQTAVSLYSLSKGALISFVKSLAIEVSAKRIRVNCVAPGLVETEMSQKVQSSLLIEQVKSIESKHPLGFGLPRDVANAVVFLLADTGRWITGTILVVDGGYTAQ